MAPGEEAEELAQAAGGDPDRLQALLQRRLTGEPLAWITGVVSFCGLRIGVAPGVYVPREQTELLARRAIERLPAGGIAVDVCCGAGALAAVMAAARPGARVLACDLDPAAVACARANGVDALQGDLLDPLPRSLRGSVDVLVAVVPYVPTAELALLHRDTLAFESPLAYDGGPDGLGSLRRVVAAAPELLGPGGALLLELGGDQATALAGDLAEAGLTDVTTLLDEDGDVRGIEASRASPGTARPRGSSCAP